MRFWAFFSPPQQPPVLRKWPLAERFTVPEGYTPNFSKGNLAPFTFIIKTYYIDELYWIIIYNLYQYYTDK